MQLLLWNVQDRDFRDILYDHRVTSAARDFQHQYITESWMTIKHSQWPQPSLAMNLSHTVPVMLLECDSGLPDRCLSVLAYVQAAMGMDPKHCSRRSGLLWSDNIFYSSGGEVRILSLIHISEPTRPY